MGMKRFCLSDSASFPEGACLRAGQPAMITGLQSETGRKLNGQEGEILFLDAATARFCVRLHPGDKPKDGIRVKPQTLLPVPDPNEKHKPPQPLFDLAVVSKHIGDASFGHYVAYARSSEDGIWRCFNDQNVREVQTREVQDWVGAYLLFYVRRDHRPQAWGPPA